jgi:hypothetical protein
MNYIFISLYSHIKLMKILFYAFFLIITSYIMIKFYLNNSAFDIYKKKTIVFPKQIKKKWIDNKNEGLAK